MKKNTKIYARYLRQLKYALKQWNKIVKHAYDKANSLRCQYLEHRIRKLIKLIPTALLLQIPFFSTAQDFANPVDYIPDNIWGNWDYRHASSADLNADGLPDLIAYCRGDSGNPFNPSQFKFILNAGTVGNSQFLESETLHVPGFTYTEPYWYGPGGTALADLDGDMDVDLIFSLDFNLYYLENTGDPSNPAFPALDATISPFDLLFEPDYFQVFLEDMDNDGDFDLIATKVGEGVQLYYHENIGTTNNPSFAAPVINPWPVVSPAGSGGTIYMDLADLDQDADLDILFLHQAINGCGSSSMIDCKYYFYENTGTVDSPAYLNSIEDAFGLTWDNNTWQQFPTFIDIDQDGDQDIYCETFTWEDAWEINNNILWENLEFFLLSENQQLLLPSNNLFTFQAADFPFMGHDGSNLEEIQITQLPAIGVLLFEDSPLIQDQKISITDISEFKYQPDPGNYTTEFLFKIGNGTTFTQEEYIFELNVDITNQLSNLTRTDNRLTLSPNPVSPSERIRVNFENFNIDLYTVRAFNLEGKELPIELEQLDDKSFQIISPNKPGLYFVKLQTESGNWIGRLIVQ